LVSASFFFGIIGFGLLVYSLYIKPETNSNSQPTSKKQEIVPTTSHKEKTTPKKAKLDLGNLQQLREFVLSEEGQDEIESLGNLLRGELGSPEKWEKACREADGDGEILITEQLMAVEEALQVYIESTPPGHDPNHIRRDKIHASALSADPYVMSALYKADVNSGILGASYHDIANAFVARYRDMELRGGHGEAGGWIFYRATEHILSERQRKLTAYNIYAHTHYTKPMPVKKPDGYLRQVYWYGVHEVEEGGVKRPVGLGPLLTRFADRLDTNGFTHMVRHMLATSDAVESGEGGGDFTGEFFVGLNQEAVLALMIPEIRNWKEDKLKPSTLEWMQVFAGSNFGAGIYSRDDHKFPNMLRLMRYKVQEVDNLVKIVANTQANTLNFNELEARSLVKANLRQVSGSKFFDRAWLALRYSWESLSDEEKARWVNGFEWGRTSYVEYLQLCKDLAAASTHPVAVNIETLIDQVL